MFSFISFARGDNGEGTTHFQCVAFSVCVHVCIYLRENTSSNATLSPCVNDIGYCAAEIGTDPNMQHLRHC